jgi:DNA-binding response OmpR family regulator
MKTLLIVDDEPSARENLKDLLSKDFHVLTADSGETGLQITASMTPDAILADLQMPKMDGLEFCKIVRQKQNLKNIPILIVSGSLDTGRRTDCFLWGADDFILKPYSSSELLARLSAKLRWIRTEAISNHADETLAYGNLTINEKKFEVLLDNTRIDLTNFEFKILKYLLKSVGSLLTREDILSLVWNSTNVSSRTIDTHICTLRKKLINFHYEIHAVHGRGYVLRKLKQ